MRTFAAKLKIYWIKNEKNLFIDAVSALYSYRVREQKCRERGI
jgi:hypothetical protein